MKTKTALLTILITALCLPAFSADEHKHKAGEKHDDHPKVEVKIPDTAEALWTEIDTKSKELADLVTAKKGDGIHVAAETVEALVTAIPSKYTALAADKKKRVDGMVKNVARALDELHEEAEEGHWDDTAKKLGQVQTAIKLIKQQVNS